MNYIVPILIVSLLTACNDSTQTINTATSNNTTESPVTTASKNDEPKDSDLSGCYMKKTGRDTAILMIEQKGKEISGMMLYDNYQKDGSRGTIKGKEEGDILKLYYDFIAEGTRSVMEVYFKKVPGGLLRGMGDMDVRADTAHFISGINYSDKEAFSKVDCRLVRKFQQ